ncbi:MAG: peptidylprolyl isomerase [Bacilli bacterium]|nr:peptidylprolyl isomerase [Bacilli bacterium]
MKKVLIAGLLVTTVIITGCTRIPELENGEQVVAEIEGSNISANNLYEQIKERYARDVLIEMIDSIILNKKYETDDDINKYVESQIKYVKEQTGEQFVEAITYYYGVNTEEKFKDLLILEAKRAKAVEDYVKTLVTDKEIKKHYKDEIVGDIRASHILIKPDVTEEMTEEEVDEKETAALDLAKEIIKKLDNGEKFADLAKEYSADEGNASKGGDLNFFNKGKMEESFEEAAYALEVNKYTTTPVKTRFGYHIILKTDEKEKPELDLIKSNIIEDLSKKKLEEKPELGVQALINLRKDNKLKIYDSELEKRYNDYMDKLLKQATTKQ